MHPFLSNPRSLGLYGLCWAVLCLVLAAWVRTTGLMSWREALLVMLPSFGLYAFICLSPWYLCRFLPLKRTRMLVLIANHLGASMYVSAVWIAAASMLVSYVLHDAQRVEVLLPLFYSAALLLYILSTLLHYLLVSLDVSRQAEVAARDSQIKALRLQINPHFLFNSLNSISALATIDGTRARDMCIKLSDLLRSTLQAGEQQMIPLADEIALLRNYLEVERVRFGSKLNIEETVDVACGGCSVPPLILQPLVENAVKHGISGMLEGGTIRIEVKCGNGRLLIRIVNPFDPEAPSSIRSGIGLANIKQRLLARYGDDASFETFKDETEFRAELKLPCVAGVSE